MFVEHVSRVPCDFCGGNPDGHNSNMTARTNMEGDNSSLESRTLDGSNMLTLSRLFAQSCGLGRAEVSGAELFLLLPPDVVDAVVRCVGASVRRIGSSGLLEFGVHRPFLLGCTRVRGAVETRRRQNVPSC